MEIKDVCVVCVCLCVLCKQALDADGLRVRLGVPKTLRFPKRRNVAMGHRTPKIVAIFIP